MSDDIVYCGNCDVSYDKSTINHVCKNARAVPEPKKMKSAEEWVKQTAQNVELVIHPTDRWEGCLMTEADIHSLVCRVQQDALASRPVVDLEKLAEEVVDIVLTMEDANEYRGLTRLSVLKALRKAQGGV